MSRVLALSLLVSGSVVVAGTTAPVAAQEDAQPVVTEVFDYPDAARILAEHRIKLVKGDGHILFTPNCEQADVVQVWTYLETEPHCFTVSGPGGYVKLELPEAYGVRANSQRITAVSTVAGATKEVTAEPGLWRGIGEGAGSGQATLVELRSTRVTAPANPPASDPALAFVAKVDGGARACSGALVDPQWVLTAKSCFTDLRPDGVTVTVGRTNLESTTGLKTTLTTVVPHPDRDLALARLAALADGVTPVRVAANPTAPGEQLTLAGFGRTKTVWAPDALKVEAYTAGTATGAALPVTAADTTTCKGDLGGPALRAVAGGYELVAVHHTSWQKGCLAETETRGGATELRVDDVGGWLHTTLPGMAVSCTSPANAFVVRPSGELWLYKHTDPLGGTFAWADAGGQQIGQGWLGARTIAGPNGVVYAAVENGELRKLHWNGTGWDTAASGGQYDVIDRGWERYAGAQYRNRITVDTLGHIYTVEPDGKLHWRTYGNGAWQHRTLTGDWSRYDLIVAAGKGVLYARTADGTLTRHMYDAAGDRWVQSNHPAGGGWQMFTSVMSAGADTLYGATSANGGQLLWYRFMPATNTWVDTRTQTGAVVGTGWYNEYNLTTAPDACALRTNDIPPGRPYSQITCDPSANAFVVRPSGELRLYKHTGVRDGAFSWADAGGQQIGQGWLGARTIAGPNGVVYAAVENGELRKLHWNGTGWDTAASGGQYDVIDRGWERYAGSEYRNRITVDTLGHIYTIEPDGKLHWRTYENGTWQHGTLTGDWARYDLIVAAGKGVLYARMPNGTLHRNVYDASSGQWRQTAFPAGGGWQMFTAVMSGGADTLYGATSANGGQLLWYRYQPGVDRWVDTGSGTGKVVGTGWYNEYNLTMGPDACRLA